MDLPSSGVYRPHQRWQPNVVAQNGREQLVAYNNYEQLSYNNLAYSSNNSPSTSSPNYKFTYKHMDNNGNGNKFVMPTSPTNKKSSHQKLAQSPPIRSRSHMVSIKSKIGVEYRRYAVLKDDIIKLENFFSKVESMHQLYGTPFTIYYLDQDGEMLPINNDDNLAKAIDATTRIKTTHYINVPNQDSYYVQHPNYMQPHQFQLQQVIEERPLLKLFLEKEGVPNDLYYMSNIRYKRKDNLINMLIPSSTNSSSDSRPKISMPGDFRQVSSIIDADILPATRRRVVLKRGGSDKPLGFYIRDGTYQRMNSQGVIEKNYGIFISRLVPGGLAESTNLLAENDEILEVNGIEVGKSKRLDQVRDMMVANSQHLIITTRPARPSNQHHANHYNRIRSRNNFNTRDRLPSTQSTSSDLGEDYIRHHLN